MLRCDVCGSTFAAAPGDVPAGEAGTYVDTRPDEAITASWIPKLPDQAG